MRNMSVVDRTRTGVSAANPEPGAAEKPAKPIAFECKKVVVYYGQKRGLNGVSLDIGKGEVTALIGPSGCGKSTFIRCLNRMNDPIPGCRVEGTILLDGMDVNAPDVDPVELRARVGMVFQKPNPFP